MPRAEYEVCGEFPVEERDEDGKWVRDVRPGGTVTLDDAVINVRALVETGVVKPVEKPAKPEGVTKKAAATGGTEG